MSQEESQDRHIGRMGWADIARGIGMLLIIEGHLGMPSRITDLAFSVHVPLFFLISGYLVKPGRPGAAARHARRLLIPYVATGVVISIIEAVKALFTGGFSQARSTFIEWLLATAFGSGTNPSPIFGIHMIGATWFLLALFFALVVFEHIYDSRYAWYITMLLFIVGLISSRYWWLPWSLQPACTALLFIHIGHEALARGFDPCSTSPAVVLLCAAIWIAAIVFDHGAMYIVTNYFTCLPLDIAGSIAGTIVICWLSNLLDRLGSASKPLRFLGKNSLPIMCFHLVELTCIPWWDYANALGLGWRKLTFALMFVAKLVWSTALTLISLKNPLLCALFAGGPKPKRRRNDVIG